MNWRVMYIFLTDDPKASKISNPCVAYTTLGFVLKQWIIV